MFNSYIKLPAGTWQWIELVSNVALEREREREYLATVAF